MSDSSTSYSQETLTEFTKAIFLKMGMSQEHATLATSVLIASDLRGIDSHGVARLSGYIRLWESGRVNAKPNMQVVHETPSTAVLDGDAGLGLITAPRAMEIAMEKAKLVGTGWVSVRNSNHFGIGAFHTLMAARDNMIGMAMTNASPLVAPTYSTERLLGTNPMCYAIPAGQYPPLVVDMATSAAANGKLEIAQRTGAPIPEGWVQTKDGQPSTNPNELKSGGALLPLGAKRDNGSHKGFGLASVVDIFSAVLSGANYGPWVPPFVSFLPVADDLPGAGIGHFLGAMRVDAFRPIDEFKENMDRWIKRFKDAQTTDEHHTVIIPGEPEDETAQERAKDGIPLNDKVVEDLNSLAEHLEVDSPFYK